MMFLTVLRVPYVRALFTGLLVGVLATLPMASVAYADVGLPCQYFTIVTTNLPPGHFPFSLKVNYKYKMTPDDPYSESSVTLYPSTNGTVANNVFLATDLSQVGGVITSVELLGHTIPADGTSHVISTGIPGVCDSVVVDLTHYPPPTPPGCPIVIDIHSFAC
ncbi:MAG: hypothetical protein JST22_19435 [Bacteroidetes bacterium]|nr:hypothetical protein [Bacteroidota bacterium]